MPGTALHEPYQASLRSSCQLSSHELIFHFCISQASTHPSIPNSKVPCSIDPSLISVGRGHCHFIPLPQSLCTLLQHFLHCVLAKGLCVCLHGWSCTVSWSKVRVTCPGHFSSLSLAPIKYQVNIFECMHKLINNLPC